MTHTLLIRLQGPMQAWGVQSRFSVRETASEPSKSGVLGLLCAALGREREKPVNDLAVLRMGVRVDREGRLMVDYHTALSVLNAQGSVLKNAVLSNRFYLADAVFLVGLESDNLAQLQDLQEALRRPRWLLSLGRRSFPLTAPAWLPDGVRENQSLEDALRSYPWLVKQPANEWEQKHLPGDLRLMIETSDGWVTRADQPVSYAERLFSQQSYRMNRMPSPATFLIEEAGG